MKILLPEAFLTKHFLERFNERSSSFLKKPEFVNKIKNRLNDIKKFKFPKGKYAVNLFSLNYNLYAIVKDNALLTIFLQPNFPKDCLPVSNFYNFKSTIQYIKSNDFPLGELIYSYKDDLLTYFFVIKDRKIIDAIKEDQIKNYTKFKVINTDQNEVN